MDSLLYHDAAPQYFVVTNKDFRILMYICNTRSLYFKLVVSDCKK